MQQQQERPPAYESHDPESLLLPSVPTHSLPSLRSLDLPDSIASAHALSSRASVELSPKSLRDSSTQWGALPSLGSATSPRAWDSVLRSSAELDIGSPMDTASVASVRDELGRRREMSVLSMDDPDVRLAAEALSGLGNPDFARSPTTCTRHLNLPAREPTAEPEPLLSLITSNHPWLGGTINGSISAYNATKGYSPRFVQYGAELIERNIGSPVVNTVSSVGRRTGVEKNLRRYLGEMHRRPSDLEHGDIDMSRKRQRVMRRGSTAMEIEDIFSSPRTRGDSHSSYAESLPAYDEHRSPNYEETAVVVVDSATDKESENQPSASQDRRVNWSTQLIMTTSGLGVALSEASLKSLKMCLRVLRSATTHIDSVMHALKLLLSEYENALHNRRQFHGDDPHSDKDNDVHMTTSSIPPDQEVQVRRIAEQMKRHSSDIWTTLQSVVQSVSRYTGGALPQNASQVVRTQLLSVPQRWQLASRRAATEQQVEEVRGANRMLAFAKEGLDMMGQITTVIDGTVLSAESWLASIGRRPQKYGEGNEKDIAVGTDEKK